jgi:hypothetical protein
MKNIKLGKSSIDPKVSVIRLSNPDFRSRDDGSVTDFWELRKENLICRF